MFNGTRRTLLAAGAALATTGLAPASAQGATISFGVRPEDLRVATGGNVLFEGTIDYIERNFEKAGLKPA